MQEKKKIYIFSVATSDTQIFDICTNKTREISLKISFKNNKFTR